VIFFLPKGVMQSAGTSHAGSMRRRDELTICSICCDDDVRPGQSGIARAASCSGVCPRRGVDVATHPTHMCIA